MLELHSGHERQNTFLSIDHYCSDNFVFYTAFIECYSVRKEYNQYPGFSACSILAAAGVF